MNCHKDVGVTHRMDKCANVIRALVQFSNSGFLHMAIPSRCAF